MLFVITQNYISAADLEETLSLLGEEFTEEELLDMITSSTGNPNIHGGDGEEDNVKGIQYHDFMKLVPPLCPSYVFKVSVILASTGSDGRKSCHHPRKRMRQSCVV